MAALELASIVAAYLRKHGFSKTLAAFSRENGETSEEVDAVDLETLYKLYTSTQVNGNRETKKSKKAKFKDTLDMANGNKNAEEMVNEGAAPKSKKKRKGEKESLVDSLMVPEIETKNILKEEGLKKKKAENLDKVNENTEGLKSKGKDYLMVAGTMKSSVEEALPSGHAGHDSALNKIVVGTHIENGGGLTKEEEVAHPHPPESLHSGSKKKKKEQGGEQLAGSKTPTKLPDSTQVSSQENGLSKKKRKKLKDTGEEDTTKAAIAAESACETPTNDQAKKLDVIKRPVELLGEPEGLGFSSKKKKHRKELLLESAGDINGKMQEPSGVEQGGEQLAGSKTPIRLPDSTQVSSDENGLSKKKIRKVKDTGEEEMTKTAIAAESARETPTNDQAKKLDVTKRPVELLGEPGGCGFSSKKKKHRKEPSLEGAGDGNSNIQEPSGVKLEASKNEEDPFDSKKQSGMKRKHKDDTSLINGISNHDHNNSMASPEKTKGGSDVIYQWNVEKHEFDSTKINKETPNNKKTPTGALAFKRVEVEKVSFSDPRLKDNSYWAKDGAEEGYGAKAQEVLGFVRGRDFRHEKTKKKRGSYRGGLIGFESHSIKFQNSDED